MADAGFRSLFRRLFAQLSALVRSPLDSTRAAGAWMLSLASAAWKAFRAFSLTRGFEILTDLLRWVADHSAIALGGVIQKLLRFRDPELARILDEAMEDAIALETPSAPEGVNAFVDPDDEAAEEILQVDALPSEPEGPSALPSAFQILRSLGEGSYPTEASQLEFLSQFNLAMGLMGDPLRFNDFKAAVDNFVSVCYRARSVEMANEVYRTWGELSETSFRHPVSAVLFAASLEPGFLEGRPIRWESSRPPRQILPSPMTNSALLQGTLHCTELWRFDMANTLFRRPTAQMSSAVSTLLSASSEHLALATFVSCVGGALTVWSIARAPVRAVSIGVPLLGAILIKNPSYSRVAALPQTIMNTLSTSPLEAALIWFLGTHLLLGPLVKLTKWLALSKLRSMLGHRPRDSVLSAYTNSLRGHVKGTATWLYSHVIGRPKQVENWGSPLSLLMSCAVCSVAISMGTLWAPLTLLLLPFCM